MAIVAFIKLRSIGFGPTTGKHLLTACMGTPSSPTALELLILRIVADNSGSVAGFSLKLDEHTVMGRGAHWFNGMSTISVTAQLRSDTSTDRGKILIKPISQLWSNLRRTHLARCT